MAGRKNGRRREGREREERAVTDSRERQRDRQSERERERYARFTSLSPMCRSPKYDENSARTISVRK